MSGNFYDGNLLTDDNLLNDDNMDDLTKTPMALLTSNSEVFEKVSMQQLS